MGKWLLGLAFMVAIVIIILASYIYYFEQKPPIYDGSRTGNIIPYIELCTGNETRIYENERVPVNTENGVRYLTRTDVKCYWDQFNAVKLVDQPTPRPTKVIRRIVPTTDPDPIINCNFIGNCKGQSMKLRSSVCSKSATCCQVMDKWVAYESLEKCKQVQGGGSSGSTYQSNLAPCVVNYPCNKTTFTYQMTIETCLSAQKSALSVCNSSGGVATLPPVPTIDQDLIRRHQEACNAAAAEWIGIRENWEEQNANSFSSSAEMVQALELKRQDYQSQLYEAGCSNTVRL
jgi:hypothetical protein